MIAGDAVDSGLTIDMLKEALDRVRSVQPIIHCRVSEYFPLTDEDGEPFCLLIEEPDMFVFSMTPPKRTVLYIHPDNLEHLERVAQLRGYKVEQLDRPQTGTGECHQ